MTMSNYNANHAIGAPYVYFRHESFSYPVLSLQYVSLKDSRFVLAGEGPYLKVYDAITAVQLSENKIFDASNVHGITQVYDGCVCVYGSKSCRIIALHESVADISLSVEMLTKEQLLSDWILTAAWIKDGTHKSCLALALAHNMVVLLKWKASSVICQVQCEQQCILYSAHLIGRSWENMILAAGTVFNEVTLWPLKHNEKNTQPVYHRLTGHQGVIFSIDYQPATQQLCSVSDDRSIRVWQCTPANNRLQDLHTLDDWASVQFQIVHVLYGHSARVWDVKLGVDNMISIGEDATCCVWNKNGKVIRRLKGHKGKNIWSLAYDEENRTIATSGGDCAILFWNIDESPSTVGKEMMILPPGGVQATFFPRIVQLLSNDCVLAMTNSGVLWKYNVEVDVWTVVFDDPSYNSYCVMDVQPENGLIAVGNLHGHAKVIHEELSVTEELFQGKVFSLIFLKTYQHEDTRFLATGPNGDIGMWKINITGGLSLSFLQNFTLPEGKQRWVSCACLLREYNLLVCGDRMGSVHVYSTIDGRSPIQTFHRLHNKAGVTDICYYNSHIYSCGRDGLYRVFSVKENQLHLQSANKVMKGFEWLAKMDFTDGDNKLMMGFHDNHFLVRSITVGQNLLSFQCGGGHRAWDFCMNQNKAIFVYIKARAVVLCLADVTSHALIVQPSFHGRELSSVLHLGISTNKEGTRHIICTGSEDTTANIVAVELRGDFEDLRTSVVSGHGEKTMHATDQTTKDTCQVIHRNERPFLGSESKPPTERLQLLQSLTGHLSNVKCLTKSSSANNYQLLFTAGGRAQLKCWKIHLDEVSSKSPIPNSSLCSLSASNEETFCPKTNDLVPIRTQEDSESPPTSCVCHKAGRTDSSQSSSHFCQEDCSEQFQRKSSTSKNLHSDHAQCQLPQKKETHDYPVIEELSNYQLHKGRKHMKPWKKHLYDSSPETRFMHISAFPVQDLTESSEHAGLHVVLAACSDAIFRVLGFDESSLQFHLLATSSCLEHCMLVVKHSIIITPEQLEVLAISAGTDGVVTIWKISDIVRDWAKECRSGDLSKTGCASMAEKQTAVCNQRKPVDLSHPHFRLALHQSGINALDVITIQDGLIIASGGDDNAVNVCRLHVTQNCDITLIEKLTVPSAHAAQVTGINILGEKSLLSVSVDQRLAVWQLGWSSDEKNSQIKLRKVHFVHVSDIACLEVWHSRDGIYVCIAGVGCEILSMKTSSNAISAFKSY